MKFLKIVKSRSQTESNTTISVDEILEFFKRIIPYDLLYEECLEEKGSDTEECKKRVDMTVKEQIRNHIKELLKNGLIEHISDDTYNIIVDPKYDYRIVNILYNPTPNTLRKISRKNIIVIILGPNPKRLPEASFRRLLKNFLNKIGMYAIFPEDYPNNLPHHYNHCKKKILERMQSINEYDLAKDAHLHHIWNKLDQNLKNEIKLLWICDYILPLLIGFKRDTPSIFSEISLILSVDHLFRKTILLYPHGMEDDLRGSFLESIVGPFIEEKYNSIIDAISKGDLPISISYPHDDPIMFLYKVTEALIFFISLQKCK